MAALPQELIEEILSRMPVKSLLRFKTASKKWYSLVSKDDKFHMKQLSSSSSSSSSGSKNLILYQMDDDVFPNLDKAAFRYLDIDSYASREIILPVKKSESCRLIGSANGLICLGPGFLGTGGCFIWNPCTSECKSISLPFPIATDFYPDHFPVSTRLFGFGYDSLSDDYKIIGDIGGRKIGRSYASGLRIFLLKTNSWKILDFSVQCPSLPISFYSNGALHGCDKSTRRIVAFDLAKEKISFLELPEEMKSLFWLSLLDYQGSLCTRGSSIWVMREYGNAKSWAKFSTPLPKECCLLMGISRLGEVVYLTTDGLRIVKTDHTQGRIADEDKSVMDSTDAFVYNESLISPKCFDPNVSICCGSLVRLRRLFVSLRAKLRTR